MTLSLGNEVWDGTKLCGGSTAPGATAWRLGLRRSLTVRVRTAGCETLGLWRTPQYFFTVLSDADYTAGSRVPVVVEASAHAVYGNASRISAVVLQGDPHGFTAAIFIPVTDALGGGGARGGTGAYPHGRSGGNMLQNAAVAYAIKHLRVSWVAAAGPRAGGTTPRGGTAWRQQGPRAIALDVRLPAAAAAAVRHRVARCGFGAVACPRAVHSAHRGGFTVVVHAADGQGYQRHWCAQPRLDGVLAGGRGGVCAHNASRHGANGAFALSCAGDSDRKRRAVTLPHVSGYRSRTRAAQRTIHT